MGDGDMDNKQLWAAISGRVRHMSYLGAPALPAMWALAIWTSKQVNQVSLVPETGKEDGKETGKPLRKRSRKPRKQRVTKERAAEGSTSQKEPRSRARSSRSSQDSQFNA